MDRMLGGNEIRQRWWKKLSRRLEVDVRPVLFSWQEEVVVPFLKHYCYPRHHPSAVLTMLTTRSVADLCGRVPWWWSWRGVRVRHDHAGTTALDRRRPCCADSGHCDRCVVDSASAGWMCFLAAASLRSLVSVELAHLSVLVSIVLRTRVCLAECSLLNCFWSILDSEL